MSPNEQITSWRNVSKKVFMQRTLIWDLPTRLFHWTLVGCFVLAWLTSEGDRWNALHVFAGYLMLGLVGFRVLWGFVGSHFSRFASFWFGPRQALDYLKQVASGDAARHVGHNPTGSLAIYLLLILVVTIGSSGVLILGGEEQHGLAAGWFSFAQIKWIKGLHELLAMAMLLLVMAHIAGVVVESVLHKENLVRSMLTGVKLADPATPRTSQHRLVAAGMSFVMLSFAGWWFDYAIDKQLDQLGWADRTWLNRNADEPHVRFVGRQLPDNKTWRNECGSCHAVFYPTLLPARSWKKMMGEQANHFGTDLGLDTATTNELLNFMVDNAADRHQTEAAFKIDQSLPKDAAPQRITDTAYWIRKHREIAAADWANPLVKSKSNCAACHSDADAGTFEDGAMQIPQTPATPAASAPASARL